MLKSAGSWKRRITAPELIKERGKCNFDMGEALSQMLQPDQSQQVAALTAKLDEHPELANTHKYYDMTRAEMQKEWMRKTNFAYKHYKKEWFQGYKTGEFAWMYA